MPRLSIRGVGGGRATVSRKMSGHLSWFPSQLLESPPSPLSLAAAAAAASRFVQRVSRMSRQSWGKSTPSSEKMASITPRNLSAVVDEGALLSLVPTLAGERLWNGKAWMRDRSSLCGAGKYRFTETDNTHGGGRKGGRPLKLRFDAESVVRSTDCPPHHRLWLVRTR